MKILKIIIVLTASFIVLPSFAIDQINLTDGTQVEGKILTETPLHIDFRFLSGALKRYKRVEVASLDRDVPSKLDQKIRGNTSLGFLGVKLGGLYLLENNTNNKILFDYGVQAGVTVYDAESSKLTFGLSFDRSEDLNNLNLQLLATRILNSGFYIGPDLGILIQSGSIASSTDFSLGAEFGYEIFMTNSISISPELRYQHVFSSISTNLASLFLTTRFHF
jgi:hypothetical protein